MSAAAHKRRRDPQPDGLETRGSTYTIAWPCAKRVGIWPRQASANVTTWGAVATVVRATRHCGIRVIRPRPLVVASAAQTGGRLTRHVWGGGVTGAAVTVVTSVIVAVSTSVDVVKSVAVVWMTSVIVRMTSALIVVEGAGAVTVKAETPMQPQAST